MKKNIFLLPTDTCFGIAAALDDRAGYHRIYEIKKRSFDKPLALMVESFEWLENYTELTNKQIEFLKNYEKPFTILTQSPFIRMFVELEDEEEGGFENAWEYREIAFRVAHTDLQRKLIEEVGPIWLTSANYAGEKEIYDSEELEKQFQKYLSEIEILLPIENPPDSLRSSSPLLRGTKRDSVKQNSKKYTLPLNPPSDIFRFGEGDELQYIRKN